MMRQYKDIKKCSFSVTTNPLNKLSRPHYSQMQKNDLQQKPKFKYILNIDHYKSKD